MTIRFTGKKVVKLCHVCNAALTGRKTRHWQATVCRNGGVIRLQTKTCAAAECVSGMQEFIGNIAHQMEHGAVLTLKTNVRVTNGQGEFRF